MLLGDGRPPCWVIVILAFVIFAIATGAVLAANHGTLAAARLHARAPRLRSGRRDDRGVGPLGKVRPDLGRPRADERRQEVPAAARPTRVTRDERGRLIVEFEDRPYRLLKLREWWAWRFLGRMPKR
jgi:hypothetical protein